MRENTKETPPSCPSTSNKAMKNKDIPRIYESEYLKELRELHRTVLQHPGRRIITFRVTEDYTEKVTPSKPEYIKTCEVVFRNSKADIVTGYIYWRLESKIILIPDLL